MHELSLTRNIVAIVAEHAGGRAVGRVRLAVGPRACVERQALLFCFEIAAAGTVLDGARLEFVEDENDRFVVKDYAFRETG